MLCFAGFELDPQQARLRGPDGEQIRLRPKSFDMLHLFAANAGRVLSKQELFATIWPNVHVADDSLFQCIREIRAALGDERRQLIKLVSGRGYLFEAKVSTGPVGVSGNGEVAPSIHTAPVETATAAQPAAEQRPPSRSMFGFRGPAAIVVVACLCAIIGLAVASPVLRPSLIFKPKPLMVVVVPIVGAGSDAGAAVAGGVTDRLADGLARIENIRVIAPRYDAAGTRPEPASATSASSDFEVRGELQRGEQSWTLRARLIKMATGEVQTVATVSVDVDELDPQLDQSRLAAGVGHLLAVRLNGLQGGGDPSTVTEGGATGSAKTVIEQATASINQTSRERFGMAETMLQKALTAEPDNIDLAVALSALQLRGIQMVWYSPDAALAAEAHAGATLERALRAKPNSIPVLETYCRFLSATNHFVESLVTCSRTLAFDPWDGLALYLVGLGQVYLGRFEDALATFQQADRFDTPQVSRWTWLLGAGWANMLMGRGDDAVSWLNRSIAITPASGRSQMLLAATYQQLGRTDEAKSAMKEGLRLRPGTTALNILSPTKNVSPVFLEASERIIRLMVAAGLPES